jgi:flagellar basal body P-ring formation protein FlgA
MNRLPLVLMALCIGLTHAEAATLRTNTTLHASTVRLSDLFEGVDDKADRVLGPAPGPGGRVVVEAPQLRAIARQFGVDWRPASSADRAVLERLGRALRRDDVMDAIRSALIAAGASADCDVDLAAFSPPLVPVDAVPRPLVSDIDYDAAVGRFSAMLSVAGEGMDPLHFRVDGRADDTILLPVAAARLVAGSIVGPKDVRMARVRTSLLRGDVTRNPSDAIGMQTKRVIAPGQPLFINELMRPSMVVKGATVLMVLDSPGIALTAQGQAIESGAIGERIRVLNPSSRAAVEAEVTGPDRVRVAPSAVPMTVSVR